MVRHFKRGLVGQADAVQNCGSHFRLRHGVCKMHLHFEAPICVKTTQYSTQPAAHSQDTNTGRGKGEDGDYERRREDGDLPFPKLKSLYFYWSLIILIYLTEYLSNNKQGKLGMGT